MINLELVIEYVLIKFSQKDIGSDQNWDKAVKVFKNNYNKFLLAILKASKRKSGLF